MYLYIPIQKLIFTHIYTCVYIYIYTRRSMGGWSPPSRSRVRVEFPTWNSSNLPNVDFVKVFDDLELRDSSEIEAKAPHLAPVSALSARLGAPRGLRSSMSSTFSMTWSSARPRNFDFVYTSEDLELLEASEPWFRQQFRGSGAPPIFRTSISSTVARISSSAGGARKTRVQDPAAKSLSSHK